jgi:TorA maturation chaperone TorD
LDGGTGRYWADVYAQLSEFFKPPSPEFSDHVASGRIAEFFAGRLAAPGLDPALADGLALEGNVRERLEEEYRRLYLGPLPPYVVPVESVYKRWAQAPDCQLHFAAEKGHLMGDPALDMIRRYRAAGIAIPEALSAMPDHIALELEYMSYLLNQRDPNAPREFLETHLDWVDDLARDVGKMGMGGAYSRGAEIARALIRRQLLES